MTKFKMRNGKRDPGNNGTLQARGYGRKLSWPGLTGKLPLVWKDASLRAEVKHVATRTLIVLGTMVGATIAGANFASSGEPAASGGASKGAASVAATPCRSGGKSEDVTRYRVKVVEALRPNG